MMSKGRFKPEVEAALDVFAQATGTGLLEASEVLLSANALVACARDSRTNEGLARLLVESRNAQGGGLKYLARLWHMTAQAPLNGLRPEFVKKLKPMAQPNDEFSDIRDPNDRRYAAEAIAEVAGDWLASFAARALVQEEAGERARAALAGALFTRTTNLNTSLSLLAEAVVGLDISTKDPGTSRARRLVRILEALSQAVMDIDPAVDDGVGRDVAAFLDAGLKRDAIGEPDAAAELAAAVLGFLRMLVRFHGTLAAEHETFEAVAKLRRIIPGTEWPKRAEGEARALARAVREALLFLAKQNIADDRLRKVHSQLVGEVLSGLLFKKAVGDGAGLPGSLASWLVTGRMPKTIGSRAALEASILASIDVDLARAFLEGSELRLQLAVSSEEIMDAVSEVSQSLTERTEGIFRRLARVLRSIDSASERRGFQLRGEPGDLVEFSASDHETSDGGPASKTVRLRTRVVERMRDGNSVEVILKAEVDRI